MSPRRAALLVFVVVLAAGQLGVGMRASRTASVTGDEPFYLLTTQSLRSDGDLDLRDDYANGEARHFWDGSVPLWKQMKPTADGRLLSPHDPGLSLLILPAYMAGGLAGVQRFLVLLWALAMAGATVLAIRFRAPPWAAALAAAAVGAGAPGIVYASQVYPEGPAALAVALGLSAATSAKARPLAVAATAAALPWLGLKYAPLAALIVAVFAVRFRDTNRRALAVAATPLVFAAVHFAWWHLHTFDGLTPYATNIVYSGEGTGRILTEHLGQGGRSYRLYGLFLDARFGLFRWLPIAPLAVIAGLTRRTLLPAATVAVTVLVGTFVSITMMGWWFPGRMLVAGLPALVVLVAHGAARFPKTAVALTAWSLAIAAAVAWAAHHGVVRLAVDPFALGLPLPPAALFPDFRQFGLRQVGLSAAWVTALVVGRSIALNGKAPSPRRQLARLPRLLRPAD